MTRRRVPWRASAAAGGLLGALFVLCYLGLVRTRLGQQLDNLSLGVGGELRDGTVGVLAAYWRDDLTLVVAAAGLVLGVVGLVRRHVRRCVVAGLLVALSFGAGQLLKAGLSRPDLGELGYPYNTFPSGHTIVTFSVLLGILVLLPVRWHRLPYDLGVWVATVLSAFASFATQAHLTSDVLGGVLLVGLVAVLLGPFAPRPVLRRRGRPLWWALCGASVVGSVAAVAVLTLGGGGLRAAAVAELSTVAAVVSLVMALLTYVEPPEPRRQNAGSMGSPVLAQR